jgi:hypothetical protein
MCNLIAGNASITLADWTRLGAVHNAFIATPSNSGRPPNTGNYTDDEESIFLEDVKRVLARHEAQGIRITSVDMLAGNVGTLGRTQFFAMLKRVPEARERFREHKRKPLRLR